MSHVYRIHLAGFDNTFASLVELKAWVSDLKRQFAWVVGETAKIWVGEGTVECATFRGGPFHTILVEA